MRAIFTLVLTLLALTEGVANAQQPKKIPRIGWIALFGHDRPNITALAGRNPNFAAFLEGLRQRGYIEGQNITIEYRSAEGREDRQSEVAAELIRLKVDVIVADTNAATRAAAKATTTIPIVFVHGDPVWDGVVGSLAQPGRNLTGLSILSFDLAGKRLELLRDAFPKISRVAVLLDPDAPVHRRQFADMESVAQALSVQLQALELRHPKLDFDSVFQRAISQRANALITLPNPPVSAHRTQVLDFASKSRLPAMYPDRRFADAGGLISYGPNLPDLYRRAAYYVDKILKGAKPVDLPVEQPTKFELVINLKTAKELGLIIPPELLMWADKVIK